MFTWFLNIHPASRASFCLLGWKGEKEALPESHQTFEVTEARTSGLVNLVLSRQTGLFEYAHGHHQARCSKRRVIRPIPSNNPTTFRPHTAGLQQAIMSIYWVELFVPPWLLVIGVWQTSHTVAILVLYLTTSTGTVELRFLKPGCLQSDNMTTDLHRSGPLGISFFLTQCQQRFGSKPTNHERGLWYTNHLRPQWYK